MNGHEDHPGRTPTARDLQARQTRERIMRKAFELVERRGYENVSITDICAACDVSKGAFYHHFSSKRDIIVHMNALLNEKLSELFVYDQTRSARQLYCGAVDEYLGLVRSDGKQFTRSLFNAMLSTGVDDDSIKLDLQRSFIFKVLEKGYADGSLKRNMSNEEFFTLFRITLMGTLSIWAMSGGGDDPADIGRASLYRLISLLE